LDSNGSGYFGYRRGGSASEKFGCPNRRETRGALVSYEKNKDALAAGKQCSNFPGKEKGELRACGGRRNAKAQSSGRASLARGIAQWKSEGKST